MTDRQKQNFFVVGFKMGGWREGERMGWVGEWGSGNYGIVLGL